jgi:endothelin-converting enzyme/putative endopeptidase
MRLRHILLASVLLGAAPVLAQTPKFAPWGVDLTATDTAVRPGDDFWGYVNGAWDKRTQIASDRTFVGIDSVLNDQIDKDVRSIIEAKAADPQGSGKLGQQIGDLYASWMDVGTIGKLGTAPIKPYLARIEGASNHAQLADLFGQVGLPSPFGTFISPSNDDPTRYAVYLVQGGLGMPGRDYYLLPGAKYDAYRAAYLAYVTRIQQLAGIPDAAAKAKRIVNLETAIARLHWTPEQSRDAKATNNPMTLAQLQAFAPQVDWKAYYKALGLDGS